MTSKYATVLFGLAACGGHTHVTSPATSGPVIDRFSAAAGHLMVRSAANHLPAPGAPIDLTKPPFITQGFGPDGAVVRYVNFDIAPPVPATRYRLTRPGAHAAIDGQPDLIDALPGEPGYSDFTQLAWVTVPADVAAGSITSVAQIKERAFPVAVDSQILDCPVVPAGTTGATATTTVLAYRGAHVTCLQYGDALTPDGDKVPTSPIYVTFAAGTPASGFHTEAGRPQTHNVVFSIPGDTDYSPLWAVHIYDKAAFASVHDASTASAAPLVEPHGPLVNCPVVFVAAKSQ